MGNLEMYFLSVLEISIDFDNSFKAVEKEN